MWLYQMFVLYGGMICRCFDDGSPDYWAMIVWMYPLMQFRPVLRQKMTIDGKFVYIRDDYSMILCLLSA